MFPCLIRWNIVVADGVAGAVACNHRPFIWCNENGLNCESLDYGEQRIENSIKTSKTIDAVQNLFGWYLEAHIYWAGLIAVTPDDRFAYRCDVRLILA